MARRLPMLAVTTTRTRSYGASVISSTRSSRTMLPAYQGSWNVEKDCSRRWGTRLLGDREPIPFGVDRIRRVDDRMPGGSPTLVHKL